jgi:FKBP-type peptidyl-prolyl cis-trans isomerase FkpA
MRLIVTLALAAAFGLAAPARAADAPKMETDEQKTLYALGVALSRGLAPFSLTEKDIPYVEAGLVDGALNREKKVDLATYGPKLDQLRSTRSASQAAGEKKASEPFLAKAAAEKGAVKLPSGLIYTEIKPGTGPSPAATDKVKVHYTGTLADGTVFDSSVQRGQPASFPLNQVIKCWTEGVQKMKVGGKSKLVCPSDLAYGDDGRPPTIKPGATLVFEVELLDIVK